MKNCIEILAPAKNVKTAKEAIKCGADSIYIACQGFSLRNGLNNSIKDIKKLVDYAHKYWVKVYVTVNSLMFNDTDFENVQKLINELYRIKVDAIIIQDMGLLELDLPNIPVIASTNTNCFTPEKAKFFEKIGIHMIVLPRELNLDEIKKISECTNIKLEAFCYGLLCVGYSGRCYLQYSKNVLTSRFGEDLLQYQYNGADNGRCDQNCFKYYGLKDSEGNYIVEKERLLNLRFNNQIGNLEKLYDAGVSSFKIEGRHKEICYVKNVVASFRQEADQIIVKRNLKRPSSGKSFYDFTPNLDKIFNKGYTDYYTTGRKPEMYSHSTMVGEKIGTVINCNVQKMYFKIDSDILLHSGDKLRYRANDGEIKSITIQKVKSERYYCENISDEMLGKELFLFFDCYENKKIEKAKVYRLIEVDVSLTEFEDSYIIFAQDENNNSVEFKIKKISKYILKEELFSKIRPIRDEEFMFNVNMPQKVYLDAGELKKSLYKKLRTIREKNRPVIKSKINKNNVSYPEKVTYLDNVVNDLAKNFYKRHNVENVEMGLETSLNLTNKQILTTKYCIRYELGFCRKNPQKDFSAYKEPWYVEDETGILYELKCDCKNCEMALVVPES